ncbi:uncharacterized protein [Montipora foliosa]|uniref:uncharacterized protein n=1 Tax=Montipora foliosa TaxID=591990 RepID=UPI0035F15B45
MLNDYSENNGVNGTGTRCEGPSPGRCSPAQQRGPGRHLATARMRWNKEVNKVVMECFYRSKPFYEEGKPIRGYRQRLFREWRDRGMFESTEQRVCDQARAIRRNGWLSELEVEAIKRQVEDECQDDLWEGQEVTVEAETVGIDAGTGEEEINDAEDGISDTEGDMNEKHRAIVKQLKKIMREGRTCNGIMFKKVDKKVLRVQTDKLGLKKAEHRKKNEPRTKRRIEGDIKRLKQEVNFLERELKGELGLKKKRKLSELNERYRVKSKGMKTVLEELKQTMLAKSAKIRRYEQRIEQFRQNGIFDFDQKKIYAEFNGDGVRSNDVPNAEESKRFWGDIWSAEKGHNQEAEWLKDLKK